jgi:glycine betaine/choline ABC-type transport system substrate-binding protein
MSGLAGCLSDESGGGNGTDLEITVGSKNFTENIILGQMTIQVLTENTDHAVIDETNYGDNGETWEGFTAGAFDTYWDYLGTLWLVHPPQADEAVLESAQAQYDAAVEQMEGAHDLHILEMTPFENSYAFMADPETIAETDIQTVNDLAAYVNRGNYDITIVIEDDFHQRSDGWPALTDHYGFDEMHLANWADASGIMIVSPGLTYDEVRRGNADVGLAYTTKAQIDTYDFQLLDDDGNFWPFYNLVPVVDEAKAPDDVQRELNRVIDALDSAETMQTLNARVVVDEENPKEVARSFLSSRGVI